MKIYSTKYALTKGIIELEASEADVDNRSCGGPVRIPLEYGGFDYLFGEGNQWHRSESEAAARAEALAVNKIASLKKQVARLEAFAETMRAIK